MNLANNPPSPPGKKSRKPFVPRKINATFAGATNYRRDMNFEQLNFTTFCVGNLSDALHMSAAQVYHLLRSSGILSDYLIPAYDVLHTFSKEYIVEDLIACMKEKGINIADELLLEWNHHLKQE